MKRRTLLILGGMVFIVAVAYAVHKHFQENKNKEYVNNTVDNDVFESVGKDSAEIDATSTSDVYETREAVVHSVKERHSKAATAMAESLNTICNEVDNDEIVTENSGALNKTSSDLDDLLK